MGRYRIFLTFMVLFLFLAGCSGDEYSAEKLYWRATKQYNQLLKSTDEPGPSEFKDVITAYQEVTIKFPRWQNTPKAHFNISQLYALQKEYAQAEKELEKIVKNFSKMPDVCAQAEFATALIYEEFEHDWDKALKKLKDIEDKYPNTYSSLQVPLHIARHYKRTSETEKEKEAFSMAIVKYKKMIKESPNTLGALTVLDFVMAVYGEQNKKTEALSYLDEVAREYPQSPLKAKALLLKGGIYYDSGETDQAIKVLEEIINDFPNSNLSKLAQEQIENIKKDEF